VHDLTVSVAEIIDRPGEYREIKVSEPMAGVRTALARLDDGPVKADLRAESVVEGILVTGRIGGDARLQCARCLTEFSSPLDLEVCELFVRPGHRGSDEDAYRVTGTEIHLEPLLRDSLSLSLPLRPLCRTDCKGICATCGADLNAGPCLCSEDDVDPRWAPLSALRERLQS
jgi:uncharacterized protein